MATALSLAGIHPPGAYGEESGGRLSRPSLSCGATNRGALDSGRALPHHGDGYTTPAPWRERGYRYGTVELIGLIERAARRVARQHPGGELAVGDLSADGGGALPRHRSHQAGRDVDLIYYAIDRTGAPFANDGVMPVYRRDGRAITAESPTWVPRIDERYFDAARNWALVEALITDPIAEVDRIFVSRSIRQWLLDYAAAAERPEELIARARAVLFFPSEVKGHSDHMHVRIRCSAIDQAVGLCRDDLAPRARGGKWRRAIACGPDESDSSSTEPGVRVADTAPPGDAREAHLLGANAE